MLSHYTGSYMFRARDPLEKGNSEQADAQRVELLSKLGTLEQIPEVISCIKYLEKAVWKTHYDVDAFNSFYTENNPGEKEHKDLIKRLFKH